MKAIILSEIMGQSIETWDSVRQSNERQHVLPTAVVLITGGSAGIGKALALEFASEGHDLFLVARDAKRLEATAAEIHSKYDVHAYTLAQDLATPDGCDRVADAVTRMNCRVEILVNNAGLGMTGELSNADPEALDALLQTNMVAPAKLTKLFVDDMIAHGRGGVLNVASAAGRCALPYMAAYGSSKAFMISFSKSLRQELRNSGVTVSVLTPGLVQTNMAERMFTSPWSLTCLIPKMPPDAVARVAYNGFATGRAVIVPGAINWLTLAGIRVLPHWLVAAAFRTLTRQEQ